MIQMAKSNLPSVEGIEQRPTLARQPISPGENRDEPKPTIEGYASRKVDAKLTHRQAVKLRDIQRYLQDSGAKLIDGSFVANRTKAIQFLIESFKK
jgi:hypothetical protein